MYFYIVNKIVNTIIMDLKLMKHILFLKIQLYNYKWCDRKGQLKS